MFLQNRVKYTFRIIIVATVHKGWQSLLFLSVSVCLNRLKIYLFTRTVPMFSVITFLMSLQWNRLKHLLRVSEV